jgi:DNA repair exonuclease SbcCD ATPase subunit
MRMACDFGRVRRLFMAASVLFALLVLPVRYGLAESPAPDALTPGEEFSRQLDELKSNLSGLNKKIEESAQALDGTTDVAKARKDIEELRASVGTLLGAVADNGVVSELGAKALKRAHDKLSELEHETRFRPQERQFLIDRWRELDASTEQAAQDLDRARGRLVELLRVLQANEDFIDELVQIRQHEKALEVIRELTGNIRSASDELKRLISAIRPPGV